MDPSGFIEARIGASPHGQGLRTTLSQIIADELGTSPDRIKIVHGDTDRTPYGWGTFASRSLVIAGGATLLAARKVRAKLVTMASLLLEASADDIVLEADVARVTGTDRAIAFETLARAAYHQIHRFKGEITPGIVESATYDPPGTFSNACHVAMVEVDVETGHVVIEKFLVAEDAGRLINPLIVDGQIHGGVAQGIANALLEEIIYDETGNILTATLADYLPPTAREIPPIEIHHLETLTQASITKAKGLGEGGAIGAPAAVVNAINDALSPFGVSIDEFPATPQRIRAALRAASLSRGRDMSFVGRSVPRLEDRPLVTGRGRFAADVVFPHMLHMRVVRSAHAHGRIVSIDTSAARALPGVVAVWTFADVADIPPIDFRLTRIEGLAPYRQTILAARRVRYVGEPVAAVFATDRLSGGGCGRSRRGRGRRIAGHSRCQRGARRVRGRPFDRGGDRGKVVRRRRRRVSRRSCGGGAGSRGRAPFRRSDRDARRDRALRCRQRRVEMHGAAKVPHWNRDNIARMLGRDPSTVHLIEGHVGGGFGIRGELYPEDVLVCLAALRLGRPVKWIEDRREHLIAANHSRQQRHKVRAAVDSAGAHSRHRRRILSRPGRLCAHPRGHGARSRGGDAAWSVSRAGLSGARACPAHQQDAGRHLSRARAVREHIRARALDGRDRGAARRSTGSRSGGAISLPARRCPTSGRSRRWGPRSCSTPATMPACSTRRWLPPTGAGCRTTCGDRRAGGECVGAGLAIFVEKSGLGPFDGVRVSVDTSGLVEVVTGAASLGQGIETVVAQICADALGADYRRVRVVHGRTDRIAFGMGAFASRATVMTGEATRLAAVDVRKKAIEVAAELLQQSRRRARGRRRQSRAKGAPAGPSVTLGEIAKALEPTSKLRGARTPGLAADGWFYTDHMNYPYGVHIAVAKVDRDTGGGDDRALRRGL